MSDENKVFGLFYLLGVALVCGGTWWKCGFAASVIALGASIMVTCVAVTLERR